MSIKREFQLVTTEGMSRRPLSKQALDTNSIRNLATAGSARSAPTASSLTRVHWANVEDGMPTTGGLHLVTQARSPSASCSNRCRVRTKHPEPAVYSKGKSPGRGTHLLNTFDTPSTENSLGCLL